MANVLSIIPFLRFLALAICLVPAVACYDKADVFDPSDEDDDDADEAGSDEADDPFASDDEAPEDEDTSGDEDAATDDEAPDDGAADDDDAASDDETSTCAFGDSTAQMALADHLVLGSFEHLVGIDALTDLELDQLLVGGDVFDWFDAAGDLGSLFAELDGGRVLVRSVELPSTGQTFTHLRFHSRDLEYGYLFTADSLRLVGAIDGGAILGCMVAL